MGYFSKDIGFGYIFQQAYHQEMVELNIFRVMNRGVEGFSQNLLNCHKSPSP